MLADNCDEFLYYEDLVRSTAKARATRDIPKKKQEAFDLLLDAISALLRENKDVLWSSMIKETIKRKKPTFSESQFGFRSFSELLEDAAKYGIIEITRDMRSGGTYVVTEVHFS